MMARSHYERISVFLPMSRLCTGVAADLSSARAVRSSGRKKQYIHVVIMVAEAVRHELPGLVLIRRIAVSEEEEDVLPAVPGFIIPHFQDNDWPILGDDVRTAAQDLRLGSLGIDFDEVGYHRVGPAIGIQRHTLDVIRPV
jgi:hypothetical protein